MTQRLLIILSCFSYPCHCNYCASVDIYLHCTCDLLAFRKRILEKIAYYIIINICPFTDDTLLKNILLDNMLKRLLEITYEYIQSLTKQTLTTLSLYSLVQVINKPTHRCGHIIDLVIVRPDDDIHRKSIDTDSLESDHYCTKSYFNVSVSKPSNSYKTVRNIANIDRPFFIAELSSVSEFSYVEKANQFCDYLRTVLDKHSPPSLRKVINHNSSPWFESIRDELFMAKRERRQAERKWRSTKLTMFKDLYGQAKHKVSKLMLTAKFKLYTERIAQASSSKELHKIVNTLSNRHPPKILPTIYPSADLPSIFIKHFRANWSVGWNVGFGYRGRRFEPRQQYVVSLSKTLYPHCFNRLSC